MCSIQKRKWLHAIEFNWLFIAKRNKRRAIESSFFRRRSYVGLEIRVWVAGDLFLFFLFLIEKIDNK